MNLFMAQLIFWRKQANVNEDIFHLLNPWGAEEAFYHDEKAIKQIYCLKKTISAKFQDNLKSSPLSSRKPTGGRSTVISLK